MEQEEDIVTQLILEDLKFYQFTEGLNQLNMTLDYYPEFTSMIARLLGIPFGQITDDWMEVYHHYIQQARELPYHHNATLLPLAQECKQRLLNFHS